MTAAIDSGTCPHGYNKFSDWKHKISLQAAKKNCKQEEKKNGSFAVNKRAVPSLSKSYCGLVALLYNRCVILILGIIVIPVIF